MTAEQRSSIEKELSVLPQAQREAAERQISAIHVTSDPDRSGYDPKTKEVLMSSQWRPGDVIHEYGHALERALRSGAQMLRFVALREKGARPCGRSAKSMYDDTTFTEPIWRMLSMTKFVSVRTRAVSMCIPTTEFFQVRHIRQQQYDAGIFQRRIPGILYKTGEFEIARPGPI